MPKLQGKTSTIFQRRASYQGSGSNNLHQDFTDANLRDLESSVAEIKSYALEILELRTYALQILQHLGLHPQPPPAAPSALVTTPIFHQPVNSIDVRVRALQNFMAERRYFVAEIENFGAELHNYMFQIFDHYGVDPQRLPATPSIAATSRTRPENSRAGLRSQLLQFLHNLGLHPQPLPAP